MHGFRMVLSPVLPHSSRTVAQYMFIILYKYHLFALFVHYIYCIYESFLHFWRFAQIVNIYHPIWEVHIYYTTFDRWRLGKLIFARCNTLFSK